MAEIHATEIYLHLEGNDDEATQSFLNNITKLLSETDEDELPDFVTIDTHFNDGTAVTISNLPGQCDECLAEMLEEEQSKLAEEERDTNGH